MIRKTLQILFYFFREGHNWGPLHLPQTISSLKQTAHLLFCPQISQGTTELNQQWQAILQIMDDLLAGKQTPSPFLPSALIQRTKQCLYKRHQSLMLGWSASSQAEKHHSFCREGAGAAPRSRMPCFVPKRSTTLSPFAMLPPAFPAPNLQSFQHPQVFPLCREAMRNSRPEDIVQMGFWRKKNAIPYSRQTSSFFSPMRKKDNSTARKKKTKQQTIPKACCNQKNNCSKRFKPTAESLKWRNVSVSIESK